MNLSSPSTEERWQLLQETAATLFPGGPNDQDLWEQANGKAADVSISGSGQCAWQKAISIIRKGGNVRERTLISKMLTVYPNNPELQYLYKEGLS